jgi:hypothetical protein
MFFGLITHDQDSTKVLKSENLKLKDQLSRVREREFALDDEYDRPFPSFLAYFAAALYFISFVFFLVQLSFFVSFCRSHAQVQACGDCVGGL